MLIGALSWESLQLTNLVTCLKLPTTQDLLGSSTGGSLYRIFVHHVWWRAICLGVIYFQGMN